MIKQILLNALLLILATSCNEKGSVNYKKNVSSISVDTTSNDYNELANTVSKKEFTISEYNTDNPSSKNIDRPSQSIIRTQLDTALLFRAWTSDPNGPHADFDLTSRSFFVVDYDGDGSMPYELIDKRIKVFYNDFIQEGEIISVDKKALKIRWKDSDQTSLYVRWTQ